MNTVLTASFWAWTALVASVVLLALYRLVITRGMFTLLHVRRSALSLMPDQTLHDRRIERIDYWGQVLTVVAFILGMLLAIVYLYVNVGPVNWPDPYPTC